MLENFVSFSLKQKLLVIVIIAFILGMGVYSTMTLPIDAFPDVTNVQVELVSLAPGRSPTEVEKFVTYPVEVAMRGLPKLTQLRSLSKYGISVITVVFEDNTDTYFARQLVLERLIEVKENLPAGVETSLGPISTAMGEIYQYTLESDNVNETPEHLTELRTIQDWIVSPILKNIPGVNEVNSIGGYIKQYQVDVHPQALVKYGLALKDVFNAIQNNNANAGGGFLEQNSEQYLVRSLGLIKSVEDVRNIVLKSYEGTPVLIRDVANVMIGQSVRQGAALKDGKKEVVGGVVMMLKGSNGREVVSAVKKKVAEINNSNVLPSGIKIKPYYDRTELIQDSVKTVSESLAEGAILVIIILFLFLGNLRTALVVAATLPLVTLMTFIIMRLPQVNLSANLMSLGGLAIAIGMVVDGSVVVVENIFRHLSEVKMSATGNLKRGVKSGYRSIIANSVKEVGKPVIFGIMIIVIVFLPLFTLEGMEKKMFTPLAITISIALVCSLFVSLFISPVLCSLFLKAGQKEEDTKILKALKKIYLPALSWTITNPKKVIFGAIITFVLFLPLTLFLGTEFIPIMDEGAFDMDTRLLCDVSLDQTLKVNKKVGEILKTFPELETAVSKTGWSGKSVEVRGVDSSGYVGIFKPRSEWRRGLSKEQIIDAMREEVSKIPGLAFSFSQPIQCRIDELIAGTKSQVVIKLFGEDMSILEKKSNEIGKVLSDIKGTTDLMIGQASGQPYVSIDINRAKLAMYGVNVADVQDTIETAISGKPATQVYEGDKTFDVTVRLAKESRNSIKDIKNTPVDIGDGEKIPLSQLADISVVTGPVQIDREYGQRLVLIQCNIQGRDIGSFVGECQQAIKEKIKMPAGYYITWGGQFENQQRAMKKILIIVPVTVGMVLLLLLSTFNSLPQALIVILNLPFALIGGVIALFISRLYLSVPASVGFIALFGVAVLNGVVLVSYMNQLRESGMHMRDCVMTGCECRLRPVLMTAAITIFSLIPMLFSTGPGSEVQKPLAVVVVGGLITSTLLTLFILPAIYSRFGGDRR